jgi:hypothetical protein
MGGMAGMVMGNPLMGMLLGGATGGLMACLFNKLSQQQPQQQQQTPYYPPPNYGNYGGYGSGAYAGAYGGGAYAGAYAGGGGAYAVAGSYYPGYPQQQPPMNWGGQLRQDGEGKPIQYTTSGGYNVKINGGEITITDPNGEHKVVHSGDPHEYVDGKRIKDWDGKTRSLILADGTKITMNATGPQGVIENYSIYDGAQSIQVDAHGNKIMQQSFDPRQRYWNDAYQADGETAYIGYDRKGNFSYKDIYNQGNDLGVTPMYKDLYTEKNHNWFQPWNPNFGYNLYGGPQYALV